MNDNDLDRILRDLAAERWQLSTPEKHSARSRPQAHTPNPQQVLPDDPQAVGGSVNHVETGTGWPA